jgi:hypothetical protein
LCWNYKLTHTKDKGHAGIKKYTTRITVLSCTWLILMLYFGKQREVLNNKSFFITIILSPHFLPSKSRAVYSLYVGVVRLYSSLSMGQEIAWKEGKIFSIENLFGRA